MIVCSALHGRSNSARAPAPPAALRSHLIAMARPLQPRPLASLPTAKLSTGCPQLDAVLGGGLPVGSLTEVAGAAGDGQRHCYCCCCTAAVAAGCPPAANSRPSRPVLPCRRGSCIQDAAVPAAAALGAASTAVWGPGRRRCVRVHRGRAGHAAPAPAGALAAPAVGAGLVCHRLHMLA